MYQSRKTLVVLLKAHAQVGFRAPTPPNSRFERQVRVRHLLHAGGKLAEALKISPVCGPAVGALIDPAIVDVDVLLGLQASLSDSCLGGHKRLCG